MISSLYIAKRSLQINQQKITTTANNIANINTEGYSRQRVLETSLAPIRTAQGFIGQGNEIQRIERARNEHLDVTYRQKNSLNSYWDTTHTQLKELEDMINDLNAGGLTASLNNFWSSWETISENPTNMTAREELITNTLNLENAFKSIDSGINQKIRDLNGSVKNDVENINSITSQLAHLNQATYQDKETGYINNEMLDKFDLLLDKLSDYGKVTVADQPDGSKSVFLGSDELVSNDNYRELKALSNSSTENNGVELYKVVFADSFEEIDLSSSGKIAATQDLRDNTLVGYRKKLDELAVTLTESVNNIHKSGYDIQNPPGTGHDFFDPNVTGASNFSLNELIYNNPDFIAASQAGAAGDNRIALQISELKTSPTMERGQTFNEYSSEFFADLGSDISAAKIQKDISNDSKASIDGYRESIKGVSLDEETANLIEFQRAFQAASKIISVSDSILQTIINLK